MSACEQKFSEEARDWEARLREAAREWQGRMVELEAVWSESRHWSVNHPTQHDAWTKCTCMPHPLRPTQHSFLPSVHPVLPTRPGAPL